MSQCYNCEKEITLKNEEVKCDSCKKMVNFPCHECKEWFSISNEDGSKKEECVYCGFFFCPNCNVCGFGCDRINHNKIVLKILDNEDDKNKKVYDVISYFGKVKIGKENRSCFNGVPISYAKGRIKQCVVRMMGYRTKDSEDMDKFNERYDKLMDVPLGTLLTINQSREKGSYGQEFRDVFNYAICRGKLELVKQNKIIDNEEVNFIGYKRVEKGHCPYLDLKNLVVKVCPNKSCTIKTYPESETHCVNPECKYKRGDKKGELRELKLKISNKDTCQYPRNKFKKEGEDGKGQFD